jgi:hypothetical protein
LQGMQQIRDHESFVEEEVKKLGLSWKKEFNGFKWKRN